MVESWRMVTVAAVIGAPDWSRTALVSTALAGWPAAAGATNRHQRDEGAYPGQFLDSHAVITSRTVLSHQTVNQIDLSRL